MKLIKEKDKDKDKERSRERERDNKQQRIENRFCSNIVIYVGEEEGRSYSIV